MSTRSPNCPQTQWQHQFLRFYRNSNIDPPLGHEDPKTWWKNPLNHNSLRLTKIGYFLLARNRWQFYRFQVLHDINPKSLLQLERVIGEPYYIQNRKTLYFSSSRDAMMLGLHANNLTQYLNSLNQ